MILELLGAATGPAGFTVYAAPGVREALDGFGGYEEAALVALLEGVVAHGLPKNREKCRKLSGEIFELKPGPLRLLFFFDPGRRRVVIVTHHFKKQKQKTPPREIAQAERIRSRIIDAQKKGTLTYELLARGED